MDNNIKPSLPNFDDYLIEYFMQWKDYHYTNIGFFEYGIKIIHCILIIFILLGPFLPHKLLPFYIIFLLLVLLSWRLFGGCVLTLLFNKQSLVPLTKKRLDKLVLIILTISVLSYLYPQYSPFNILYQVVNYLDKYND